MKKQSAQLYHQEGLTSLAHVVIGSARAAG